MHRFHRFLVLALCLLWSGAFLKAQVTGARLTGIVTDPNGAAVSGAQLVVTNTQTNGAVQATTNTSGEYTIPSLPAGQYQISTKAPGFSETLQSNVQLTIGQNATVNVILKVGGSMETVSVTSTPTLLNASTAEISSVVEETSIQALPLNGRDPSSLVFLSSGVTNELQSQAATLPTTNSFPTQSSGSAGGGRQGSTYYLLDASRTWTITPFSPLHFRIPMRPRSFALSRIISMRGTGLLLERS